MIKSRCFQLGDIRKSKTIETLFWQVMKFITTMFGPPFPQSVSLTTVLQKAGGPLCEFLGVPVLNEPFPHLNDRFKIQVVIFALSVITWIWPLLVALPILALLKLVKYLGAALLGR
jgi:hypothetical protein